MNLQEVYQLLNDSDLSFPLRGQPQDYSELDSMCIFTSWVPLALKATTASIDRNQGVITIEDETGTFLGELHLCKGSEANIGGMTDQLYAAYINEVPQVTYGFQYFFQKDYLILDSNQYQIYKNGYLETAPFWGGFIHEASQYSIPLPCNMSNTTIKAVSNLRFPTTFHQENITRSVTLPYAFERFLKEYHLLELLFDWQIVERIKALGQDLKGIGQILAEYRNTSELKSLNSIIHKNYKNIPNLVNLLSKITVDPTTNPPNYIYDKGFQIFFEFSKDSNPVDKDDFVDLIAQGGTTPFSVANLRRVKMIKDANGLDNLIIQITAFWVYRIRCCIAHNKLGEYVMTLDDEKFVVEFGEPLLKEVLLQVFKT